MQDKKETPYQKFIRSEQEKSDFASTKKSEIKKEISQRWKNLSDTEKEKYGLVKKKKTTSASKKKTAYDFFYDEVIRDLENCDDDDIDDARSNIENLWNALSPDAKKPYEEKANPPKKRKAAEKPVAEKPAPKKANKGKTKSACDFYLEEKKAELHQKAQAIGFSTDQVVWMAMMTFENLPASERQVYIDMAEKPEKEKPKATEVYMIIDDDEVAVVKKEKNISPEKEALAPAVETSPLPTNQNAVETSPLPTNQNAFDFQEFADVVDYDSSDAESEETMFEKFEKVKKTPEKLIELFQTDINDAIEAHKKSPPADKIFSMKQMIQSIEKKYDLPQQSLDTSIQKIFKNYITERLKKK